MKEKIVWNTEIEVLVVGAGFAGLTAAIEAKKIGKNVVVIEKMKKAGGNSIISDGGIAAPDTELQKKHNIYDSEELMYDDMMKAGLGLNNPELLKTLTENAGEALLWSIDDLKVPYLDRVDIFGGHSVARCYTPVGKTGATIIKKMLEKVKELNIPILYSTALETIINDDNSCVEGVVVLNDYDYKTQTGNTQYIKTKKGIILAAGGYGADVLFRSIQDPRLNEKIQTTNKPFTTSEVMKSAFEIGAASVQLSHIQLGAWASPDEKGFGDGPLFADYILFKYGIIIDPVTGKRFINELGDRKQMSDAILNLGYPCIGIADERAVRVSGWDISKSINKGVVKIFDSIEDLSEYYSINVSEVSESIDRYNMSVKKGVDYEFKKTIVKDAKEIEESPFYAMRLWPKVHFTMGGLAINKYAQVLDYKGSIIKGLFAAGEIVGGVHGASRLGSCAVTECLVFGRIAGKNI